MFVDLGALPRLGVNALTTYELRVSRIECMDLRFRIHTNVTFHKMNCNNHNPTAHMVTGEKLHAIFPRASKSFLKINRPISGPKSKQVVRYESMGTVKRKKENPNRSIVRVTSFRRRLLDFDNLCPKYFVDSLRYCDLIEDDNPQHIDLQIRQEKVKTKQEERTEIEIETL